VNEGRDLPRQRQLHADPGRGKGAGVVLMFRLGRFATKTAFHILRK
jgi:hypothetical protein